MASDTINKSLESVKNSLYYYQNIIIVIGLSISFSGGSWDITFHILNEPESFFSYPHTLVYTGILLVIITFYLNLKKNLLLKNPNRRNNLVILGGTILILAAGPFDYSWHLTFGLDGLLSPPHVTLLSGWLIVGFGNLKITTRSIRSMIKDNWHSRDFNDNDFKDYIKDPSKSKAFITTEHHQPSRFQISNENITRLKKIELVLNLSLILMILSGFIYFFSLPFSETRYYNFNPDPLFALIIYSFGFPFLFSYYIVKVMTTFSKLHEMVVGLVGCFYIIIMLFTQILSNPFLAGYWIYYVMNFIPFIGISILNKTIERKYFNYVINNNNNNNNVKDPSKEVKYKWIGSFIKYRYLLYAIVIGTTTYSICFPLNTYILNEILYGYLIYQNLVVKVYGQIFIDYITLIFSASVIGSIIGFFLATKPLKQIFRFTNPVGRS